MEHRGIVGWLSVALLWGCGENGVPVPDEQETDASTSGGPGPSSDSDPTGDTEDPPRDTDDDDEIEVDPAPGGMRRLTARQYTNTIGMLLGPDAAAAAEPPGDASVLGFDAIGAREESLSPVAVEHYERSAMQVAVAAVHDPQTLAGVVPCAADPDNNSCFEAVARDFGRVAWRRAVEDEEVNALVDLAKEAKQWSEGDFRAGVQYELAAILQAPDFIYVVELGGDEDEDGRRTLGPYELATRMSLFILGRAPDPALLARADAGELDDDESLRGIAYEMIGAPAANETVQAHFDELLHIRELPNRTKDPAQFPDYSPDLAASMRAETLRFISEALFVDGSYRKLFTASYTFMDDRLAAFYGVEPGQTGLLEKRDLPAGQKRRGVLTQPALLAVHAHPDRNSPTRRGKFMQKTILCNEIPPPPGDQDTSLPEPEEPTTLRARLEQHLQVGATCAGCHSQTDPPGFAFEYYDATGAYRKKDNGYPVDASGEIDGLGSWEDARGLAALVADDPRTARCAVQNLYRFAIGHANDDGQELALERVGDAFVDADLDYRELIVELVLSPAFRRVGEAQ